MKIFRYRLRKGNLIYFHPQKAQMEKHKMHKKTKNESCSACVPAFVLFVISFFLGTGAINVAHAANRLDSLETVELVAQLLAQVTDVHVDAAIEW